MYLSKSNFKRYLESPLHLWVATHDAFTIEESPYSLHLATQGQEVEKLAKQMLADLVINNPNLGVRKTIQLFGLKLALDSTNPRELRSMFGTYNLRSWYRLIAEAKSIKLPITRNPFSIIREHLSQFDPLELVAFEELMLNNDKYN